MRRKIIPSHLRRIGDAIAVLALLFSLGAVHALERGNTEADIAKKSSDFRNRKGFPQGDCPLEKPNADRQRVMCVRQYAADQLLQIDALLDRSRVYRGLTSSGSGEMWADLGGAVMAEDYLARQVSRIKVLANYANPYIQYLQDTEMGVESKGEAQVIQFWTNTIHELDAYLQVKEPNGAVAQLHGLFLQGFVGLTYANCQDRLGRVHRVSEYGNDFFSATHKSLLSMTQWRCRDRVQVEALENIGAIFTRFNRDLSGKFPFSSVDSVDADAQVVKHFFMEYGAQRDTLRHQARQLVNKSQQISVSKFLDQLDAIHRYWGSALGVEGTPRGLNLRVLFRELPNYALKEDQVVSWKISTADQDIAYPNTDRRTLEWVVGHSIGLSFVFADNANWSPQPDSTQKDFIADGKEAAFVQSSPWALLRLIETHRPQSLPATLPGLPPRYWLEFKIPLKHRVEQESQARLYLGLVLDMPLLKDYPHKAPVLFRGE